MSLGLLIFAISLTYSSNLEKFVALFRCIYMIHWIGLFEDRASKGPRFHLRTE